MTRYTYTANAWGYFHAKAPVAPPDIADRLSRIGFEGFDLLVGKDAFPPYTLKNLEGQCTGLREGRFSISSLVLVSFDVSDVRQSIADLCDADRLARDLSVTHVHLLPRKPGITRKTGFRNLKSVWREYAARRPDTGVTVSVENHSVSPSPDDDLFLVRTEHDFEEALSVTDGKLRVKLDPAWLLMAGESPISVLQSLLSFVEVLDVKDFRDGRFVEPGRGIVNFGMMADIARGNDNLKFIAVETEAHHLREPALTDIEEIDSLHARDLHYFLGIFG